MWGWVVCAIGLVFLISGVLMMVIDQPGNQPKSSSGQPLIKYDPAFGSASVALVSIGSLMITGGLVAEIVTATMRPSLGGRRR
jgi:hypothetical protein